MGYYSTFEIEFSDELELEMETGLVPDWPALLEEYSGGYHFYAHGQPAAQRTLYSGDSYKWYRWRDDMHRLSKAYPAYTITIAQSGEDGEGHKYQLKNGTILREWRRGWEEVA